MAGSLINKRRILTYPDAKWKNKNHHPAKSVKIFAIKCAKMIKRSFTVVIKRRKIDEHRS